MKSLALAFSVILLLGTTLLEGNAHPVEKRDLHYDLGMASMAFYGIMEDIYHKAPKFLQELFEAKPIARLRSLWNEVQSAIVEFAKEFEKELKEELKKIEKEDKKKKRKHEEQAEEKEKPQVAQENQDQSNPKHV